MKNGRKWRQKDRDEIMEVDGTVEEWKEGEGRGKKDGRRELDE